MWFQASSKNVLQSWGENQESEKKKKINLIDSLMTFYVRLVILYLLQRA